MKRVTEPNRKILRVLHDRQVDGRLPPTIREITKEVGLRSTNGICEQLQKLEELGLVSREPQISRGLKLTAKGTEVVQGGDPPDPNVQRIHPLKVHLSELDLKYLTTLRDELFGGSLADVATKLLQRAICRAIVHDLRKNHP